MAKHGDDAFGGLLADFDAHDTLDAPTDDPVADPEPPAPEHTGEADPEDDLAPHQRVFTPAIPDLDDDELPPPPSRRTVVRGDRRGARASRRTRRLALAALAIVTCAVVAARRHPAREPAPRALTTQLGSTDIRAATSSHPRPRRHRRATNAGHVAGHHPARGFAHTTPSPRPTRRGAPRLASPAAPSGPPHGASAPHRGDAAVPAPPQAAEFDPDVTPTERTQP